MIPKPQRLPMALELSLGTFPQWQSARQQYAMEVWAGSQHSPALPPFFPKLKKAWHLQPLLRAPLRAWPQAKLPLLLLQQIRLSWEPGWWDNSLAALAVMKRLVLAAQGCFRKLATVSGCVGVGPRQQTMNGVWPACSILDCRNTQRGGICTGTACAAFREELHLKLPLRTPQTDCMRSLH